MNHSCYQELSYEQILQNIQSDGFCYLALASEQGVPSVNAMMYAYTYHDKRLVIYMAASENSETIHILKGNNAVDILLMRRQPMMNAYCYDSVHLTGCAIKIADENEQAYIYDLLLRREKETRRYMEKCMNEQDAVFFKIDIESSSGRRYNF
ncbi:pyridoxamine 5'-phosphate oxidase family protein [Paludicola sp. MB14-C6]|uniref:pyridoxamine 5'-phosphate oxidase family protein n=1 Tax=Paludihabitans sp. MB14-C6 TaxID=3070656 RepID=UPI0027DAC56D|nr:pyridoxamine 5'-phosphate oxidase family protein [Paludicola sp. MB14-C6]WMJ22790.1 pyridoxamine 5'-phosphate oxidase family protein [Paludicola sp. MB14-C6]